MTGIYTWSHGKGGVHFYRQAEPIRVATDHGIPTGKGSRLDDEICEQFDTIQVHMLWDERNSQAWEKLARQGCHRLVFDIDDVMWAPDWEPFSRHYTPGVLNRVFRNISLAGIVTTPSAVIAEYVSQFNANVWVVPNTVPEWLTHHRMPARPDPTLIRPTDMPYRVGYQGSPSHEHDFPASLMQDLLKFLHARPPWGLHFWGPHEIGGWSPWRVGYTPWQESVTDYYRSLSMDIGIGPLKRSIFNSGKSALRAIEYAALGIPAILSAGPAYDGWVEHGVTGLLLDEGEPWYAALHTLAGDDELRAKMSSNARDRARDWTTEANIGRWVEAWNSL